jgi:hypothetical protein
MISVRSEREHSDHIHPMSCTIRSSGSNRRPGRGEGPDRRVKMEEISMRTGSLLSIASGAILLGFGFISSPASAAVVAVPAVIKGGPTQVQPIHWRPWHHCHWKHGHRICHGDDHHGQHDNGHHGKHHGDHHGDDRHRDHGGDRQGDHRRDRHGDH